MYKISSKMSWQYCDNKLYIIDESTFQVYRLNHISLIIWQGLEKGLNEKDIAKNIYNIFKVDIDKACMDLDNFLNSLVAKGFIEYYE